MDEIVITFVKKKVSENREKTTELLANLGVRGHNKML